MYEKLEELYKELETNVRKGIHSLIIYRGPVAVEFAVKAKLERRKFQKPGHDLYLCQLDNIPKDLIGWIIAADATAVFLDGRKASEVGVRLDILEANDRRIEFDMKKEALGGLRGDVIVTTGVFPELGAQIALHKIREFYNWYGPFIEFYVYVPKQDSNKEEKAAAAKKEGETTAKETEKERPAAKKTKREKSAAVTTKKKKPAARKEKAAVTKKKDQRQNSDSKEDNSSNEGNRSDKKKA